MFTKSAALAILAFTSATLAAPAPAPAAPSSALATGYIYPVINPDMGHAVGGAIDIANGHPVPTASPSLAGRSDLEARIAAPPQYLTISIINKRNEPISTSHAVNAGAPTPVSGAGAPGTIAIGATAAFAVPTGWAGNVAIIDALAQNGVTVLPETGDNSLIEASFVVSSGYTVAVADVDVSYVNGFSGAITCSCSGVVVSGCNKWLWDLNTCPNDNGIGACQNPLRASTTATAPTAFFAPCEHAAYTYPNDNAANSWGACQSGQITCCVGQDCPANPNQPA